MRVDLATKRLIKEIFDRTTHKSYIDVIETALRKYAKELGIKPKKRCKYNTKEDAEKLRVFCAKDGQYKHYDACIRCSFWEEAENE